MPASSPQMLIVMISGSDNFASRICRLEVTSGALTVLMAAGEELSEIFSNVHSDQRLYGCFLAFHDNGQ